MSERMIQILIALIIVAVLVFLFVPRNTVIIPDANAPSLSPLPTTPPAPPTPK